MTKVSAMQFRQIAEYTIARFGLTDTPEELMQEWDDMASVAYSTTVEAKPGALDYLRDLKASGVKLGVATSLPPHLREPALRHVGMFDLFNDIVSVDDANDVGKDQPDVYLLAAKRLGAAPVDCTVFEDLLVGMKSAKSVGMKVWAMHDDSSASDWPEISATWPTVSSSTSTTPRACCDKKVTPPLAGLSAGRCWAWVPLSEAIVGTSHVSTL